MVYAKTKEKEEWQKHVTSLVCVLIASLIMSVNIKSFVRAGNLIPGGFTGLSLLLQRAANDFMGISLPYSFINIALNAVPAFIGFKMIGKKFTSYSVMMIILNSFLVDLIPVTPITYDPLLVSVFGGILNGLAIVIALYGKASSGGTDFIAVYLSNKLKKPSWNFVFGINVVILMAAGLLFGFEEAMYSIIFQFVSTQIIERFHQRDQKATLFIVTNKAELLEQELMSFTHHGVTRIEGQGCYLKENKAMLYTVVGADEVKDVIHLLKELDSSVFVNIVKSEGVTGRFYQEPIE
ncbi:MAG: YitT family protein [Longibaculum sp.]